MGERTYSFDRKMLLADAAAAMTASGIAQVSAANAILDLAGAAPLRTDLGITGSWVRNDIQVILDVSAITVGANNLYRIWALGSNNSDLTAGQVLGGMELGNTAVNPDGAATSVVGRYEFGVSTEQADIKYRYLGLYVEAVGTTPSITFSAFGAVLPEI